MARSSEPPGSGAVKGGRGAPDSHRDYLWGGHAPVGRSRSAALPLKRPWRMRHRPRSPAHAWREQRLRSPAAGEIEDMSTAFVRNFEGMPAARGESTNLRSPARLSKSRSRSPTDDLGRHQGR